MQPRISFEFFPPRTEEQRLILESTWQKLAPLRPDYLSVTFGAGGSTLDATRETVEALAATTAVPVAPHISCMARSEVMLREILQGYRDQGISRIVVLRGDRPEGLSGPGPFQHADELVAWVRREFGDAFHINVACYPEFHSESPSPRSELHYLRQKVEAHGRRPHLAHHGQGARRDVGRRRRHPEVGHRRPQDALGIEKRRHHVCISRIGRIARMVNGLPAAVRNTRLGVLRQVLGHDVPVGECPNGRLRNPGQRRIEP